MMWLLSTISGRLKFYLGAAGAIVAAILGAYVHGRKSQRLKDEHEDLVEYGETRGRIDDAEANQPVDAGSARDWLRKRQDRQ
jgi:hypothetical protein